MTVRATPPPAVALAALATATLCLAGCASEPQGARAAVRAASSAHAPLFDAPAMRRARLWREIGARHLERAYAETEPVGRKAEFDAAFDAFGKAQSAYHEALAQAPERFQPVIEGEIEQVARYMHQIQRDYGAPLPLD
ncbi:MAG: hypothetical protein D6776_09195 [Planctomycetota bacterium]|nr:MAG: hypothetical protein D6776_09195 [Planctomycetota bacterium]